MADRRVLVYRETLVNPSEPFIAAQGEGLRDHEAWYLSVRRAEGHRLPAARDLRWERTGTLRRAAWKRWGVAPRTTRAVRDIAPALVHAHFGRDAVQVMPLVDHLGIPLVTTFHGHDATRTDADLAAGSRSDRLYLRRRPELARAGARFLAVSAFIADALVERGFPSDRVEVHHIGVDVDAIQRATANIEREPGLVLFVGRLVAQKGLDDLVGALTRLGRVDDLVVIGDGAERRSLEAVAPQGRFLGARDQREVWRWMARASVVVVPSKTGATGAREAFGLVAAEAQAAGTPVVATTNGGLREAIAPSLQQLQVPEGDVDALADAIDRAAGVADAAVEARAWIAVERNLARQNERLDAIYRKVAP